MLELRLRFIEITMKINPRISPMVGDRKIKAVVLMMPDHTSVPTPPLAMPAPMSPPISACEELLGKPKYQVVMFQMMAPPSAERITRLSITLRWTMPLPTVCATSVPIKKAAIKLKNAAQKTACLGVRTRVETMVEIELDES